METQNQWSILKLLPVISVDIDRGDGKGLTLKKISQFFSIFQASCDQKKIAKQLLWFALAAKLHLIFSS